MTSDIRDQDPVTSQRPTRRRPGATATPVPGRYAGVYADYETAVTDPLLRLDDDTRRNYLSRVRQYLAWLDATNLDGDPLTDPAARDWAARDYRAHLLTVLKRKPTTVNAHLTAIDDFNRRLGLGPATAKRTKLPNLAPRALDQRAQVRFLREAELSSPRDRAMGYTAFYAGTRIHELVAFDLDDLRISARKGVLIVRMGKSGKYREVNLHAKLRAELETWLKERATLRGTDESKALFLNVRGRRLSARAATDVLNGIADRAGIEVGRDEDFTTHVLRHTLGTKLAREGVDVVTIAELLGHSLETARRYTLPTDADRQAAIDKLTVDE
ncbi:integrase [Nonomuraea sp. MG754425]|uniref:tyrosine-type recombinase/integrase n=1 Tax=Nonomuraea sp. MG754425 TaxID=2570319 RepID=UPI001F01DC60|nr:tyrosine-type recombinase/integrase [Nonomuraea sp. MG754425]MCF6467376.1 integrase [Nonomuraea sp. MG754425]